MGKRDKSATESDWRKMKAESRRSYVDQLEREREDVVSRIEELMGHIADEMGKKSLADRKNAVGKAPNDYHFSV